MNNKVTYAKMVDGISSQEVLNGTANNHHSSKDSFVSHGSFGVEKIIKILESRLPRSGHVYNCAKMYELFKPAIKVYSLHGSLTSEAIIILTTHREDYQQDIQISIPSNFKPTEEIKEAFSSTKAIDWDNSAYLFAAIERIITPMICEISCSIKGNSTLRNPNFYFVMDNQEALNLPTKLEDEGTTECRSLNSEEGIQFLVQQWKLATSGTDAYVRRMVGKNPSTGLYVKGSNKVLSGIMTNTSGLIGMLSTLPEERQKGFAVAVMKNHLKLMAIDGFSPSSAVEEKNVASANFHKKVGMRFSHHVDYVIHAHTPFI